MTDSDILHGLDFPTPCAASTATCDNPTVAYGTCHNCGFTAPTCSMHRLAIVQTLFLAALGRTNTHCPACKTTLRHVDSIRFEPIGSHQ